MTGSTWTWNGGIGFSTTAADWTLTSGLGNTNEYPQAGDTVIIPSGLIQDGLGEMSGQGTITILAGATILVTAAGDGIDLGTTIGTSGTLTVTGAGAALNVGGSDAIVVGDAGTGVLNVQNGGSVQPVNRLTIGNLGSGTLTVNTGSISTTGLFLGAQSGGVGVASLNNGTITTSTGMEIGEAGSGTMTVGAGGTLLFGGTVNSIGANAGSSGTLEILNGGTVRSTQAPGVALVMQIGNSGSSGTQGASVGSVLVSGLGSLLDLNTNGLEVGDNGNGFLTVAQGGTVNVGFTNGGSGAALRGGFSAGSDSVINVTGTGSVMNLQGFQRLAKAGNATFTVSNGANVNITNATTNGGGFAIGVSDGTGAQVGGTADATVTSHGTITSQSTISVGGEGTSGTLNVNSGGLVVSTTALTIASAVLTSGTVLGGTGAVNIGAGGTINITGTPTTNFPAVVVGSNSGGLGVESTSLSQGILTISGAGALLNTGGTGLMAGADGQATILISQGASLVLGSPNSSVQGAFNIARFGNASLTITDPGSQITSNGGGYIGRAGDGNLVVENHAIFNIGTDPTGSGGLTLGGAGLLNNNTLAVGGFGTGLITSAGTLTSANNITVGSNGSSGSLTINNGGSVNAAQRVLIAQGTTIPAGGGILATTSASTAIAGNTVVGSEGGIYVGPGGTLVAGGGGITSAGTSAIGIAGVVGTTGTLDVSGAGALVQSLASRIGVGSAGDATMTVSQGATVLAATPYANDDAIYTGFSLGSTGAVTVADPGTKLIATGQFAVGVSGQGSLLIENQATVSTGNNVADTSQGFDIGVNARADGSATVSGASSLLSNTGRFVVGDSGIGSLSIAAGGTVTTSPGGALDGVIIANTTSASGSSVNLSGAGSNLQVTGALIVGAAGAGALSLSQGASVTAPSLDLASAATGDGNVSIAGIGTTLDIAGALTLGDQAAGELSILGGAQMTIAGGVIGGSGIHGTGNLDIEDAGSQLTINGGVLVIGANGPAEFTLGIGANLDGQISTDPNGVTNLYGNVDPATLLNDGAENIGNSQGGSSQADDFFIANSGTITIKGTATFYAPLVTFETAALDGSTSGLWVIGAHDTLVLNTTSVDGSQTFQFGSAIGAELVIGQMPSGDINNLDTMDGQTTPVLSTTIAPGSPNVLAGWEAPIQNYASGDVIALQGLTYGSATASGDVVTVWSEGGGQGSDLGTLTFLQNGNPSSADATAAAAQISKMACFAAGTRIATVDGLVAVERLAVGDRVVTTDGRSEPVVWIGFRRVDCTRHPKPEKVWPVRVNAGAFGASVPARELYLSPDHAVFVNGMLVPVKLLENGTSIAAVKRRTVTYYHIELPEHAVILAEGLAVESYLDIGDRANFRASGTIRLFPDFAAQVAPDAATLWETKGAAPLVMSGEKLESARNMLANHAALMPGLVGANIASSP